jgi:hypothetical protein
MTSTKIETFNRGQLKRLAAAGRLEIVESYNFDDMHGVSRTGSETIIPVMYPKPDDWRDRKEGTCYLSDWEFKTKSGCAWRNPNGTITLVIHSNHNLTFRVKQANG